MQHVQPRWLKIFNYILIGADVVIFTTYLLFQVFDVLELTQLHWGMVPLVLVLAFIHAVYALFIFPFVEKQNTWAASLVSMTIYGLLLTALFEISNHDNLWLYPIFALFIFFIGMNGIFAALSAVILTWVLTMITFLGLVANPQVNIIAQSIMAVITTVFGFGGWLFFKRFYIKDVGIGKIITLSNMLEQEQFKSGLVLESITDGVLIINTKGTVEVLNQSAATMLGWTKAEAQSLDYRSLLPLANASEEDTSAKEASDLAITTTFATGRPTQAISFLQTHSQQRLYVDIVASPMFEENTKSPQTKKKLVGVIAVLRDVDQQKREEEQRSDFISTASHEMRTPVASIQGYLELALNPKLCVVDEKAQGYLVKAHEATKHLGELFQDLLTVSKGDDGRLNNNPEVVNVVEFLGEMTEQGKLAAEKKGLQVVFDDGSSDKTVVPLMYVYVDKGRLREVVLNLFDNAIKYTQKGIVTIGCSLKEQGVTIRISDTGMGIANEDIPHLFQKFYRTDNSATREIGGTGLGLYICKQMVDLMRGKIWVESTVGAGSTFYVELPRISPDAVAQLNAANKTQEVW